MDVQAVWITSSWVSTQVARCVIVKVKRSQRSLARLVTDSFVVTWVMYTLRTFRFLRDFLELNLRSSVFPPCSVNPLKARMMCHGARNNLKNIDLFSVISSFFRSLLHFELIKIAVSDFFQRINFREKAAIGLIYLY